MQLTLLWLLALSCLAVASSVKVLGVFPMPSRSHYILGRALMKGLAERGHEVTMISPFDETELPKQYKYRSILIPGVLEQMEELKSEMNMFDQQNSNSFINSIFLVTMMSSIMEETMSNANVQKLLHSGETFDVVIVEQFLNDGQKAFSTAFKAPLITFSTVGANQWINSVVGNPSPPSYISDLILGYTSHMTFMQRVHNTAVVLFNTLLMHSISYWIQNNGIQRNIPNPPALEDVLYNSSIVLLNSHWSTNPAVPHVPNMINIGGYHISKPKSLPKDLQQFLDDAKDGVVYFSMGSNLKSADLPVEKRDALIKVFSKLKQKVLWKWEDEALPGQPPNVKLGKWLPQQDVLAHPNIKLFITHGGLLSTTEAIYHGVPVLAIPIFADQKVNANLAVINGFGLMLPYSELSSEEAVFAKLTKLLTDPKYENNAKKRSEIFHDRLVKPMDEANYWVEYVARHGGAPHLRVAGIDLPWYIYHSIDVIAFVAIVGFAVLAAIVWIVKKFFFKFCCKNKVESEKKHKKH